jgi:inhibitor of KinA
MVNIKVLAAARCLKALEVSGVVECIPTIRSLRVHYEPLTISRAALEELLAEILQGLQVSDHSATTHPSRIWRLPVCYDLAIAPDLTFVAERTGLPLPQVVELHSSATYHVYMLGFLPGLAYLGDLAPEACIAAS